MQRRKQSRPGEKILTDEERASIVEEYLEDMPTYVELAAKYGVSKSLIGRVIVDSGALEEAERRANSRAKMATIRLKNASVDAAEKLIELLNKKRSEKQVYADIQIIQQVLDRGGVRSEKEEKQELTISFAGGCVSPKMPEGVGGDQ